MILLLSAILMFSSKLLAFQETSHDYDDSNLLDKKLMPYFHSNDIGRNEIEMFRIISEEIKENRKELKAKEEIINQNVLEINLLKRKIAHLKQENITTEPLPGVQ